MSLLLRLRDSCHLPDETEFLRTYKCGDWGDVSHVGTCSPCVKKQRKVIYKETRRWSRCAEKNRDNQGRSGGTCVSDLSALDPPCALPFRKIPLVPYNIPYLHPVFYLNWPGLDRVGENFCSVNGVSVSALQVLPLTLWPFVLTGGRMYMDIPLTCFIYLEVATNGLQNTQDHRLIW